VLSAAAPEAPSQGIVRVYRLLGPDSASFLDDVLSGLSLAQKAIPPKYFYDERGSRLFEQICALEEYYPTRTELAIMHACVDDLARLLGPETELVEFGSGASVKSRILIERIRPSLYVPVDLAEAALREAADALAKCFPWLNVTGLVADFAQPFALPEFVGPPVRRRAVYFPGSTIGNFTPAEALAFLRRVHGMLGAGGMLVIGVDTKKSKAVLDAAYDDARGVTAQFNLNLLRRINRELGGDFQLARFRHKAFYDEAAGRVEMHLESTHAQFARVAGRRFDFAPGETIHTEISCKYGIEEFRALGDAARFHTQAVFTDPERRFAVYAMMAV
jgi:dimethylhistidine N-methyltransferase